MLDSLFPQLAAQHLYDMVATDERDRLERYKRAWLAYRGELPDALRVKPNQPNDNVQASKCRVIVDAAVSFLFGQNIEFEVSDAGQTPEEDWLDACWNANRKMTLLNKLGVNGAVCGHTFIKIVPNHPATAPYPRLIVLDPANVSCTWDDDDVERVTEYRIQWNAIDPTTRKAVIRRQLITRQPNGYWLIRDFVSMPGSYSNRWTLTGEQVWAYPWSPILDCQNIPAPNEFWGESDIPDDIINLTQSRNFALSNWARIIKYQAHQRLWGKGFRDNQVKIGVDDIFIIESEAGQLASIEPTSNMAGLSDLDRRLDEAIHEASRTPAIATGKVEGIGQLSGVALQILYGPLLQKNEVKRQTYGDMLRDANRHLLELGGFGADVPVSIVWPEVLPQDSHAERVALQADRQMGVVSLSTVAQKLGYDWETEQARLQAEAEAGAGGNTANDKAKILGYHIETGVATRIEARAVIGLPPEQSGVNEARLRDLKATIGVTEQLAKLGVSQADAMRATGLDQQIGAVPGGSDAAGIIDESEAARLKTMFEAAKAAVDAGVPLDTFLRKYLEWSDAEINAITQAQEDTQASELEAQQRQMDMLRMQQGMPQGGMSNGEPGQAGQTAPGAVGGAVDGGGTSAPGGNGGNGG